MDRTKKSDKKLIDHETENESEPKNDESIINSIFKIDLEKLIIGRNQINNFNSTVYLLFQLLLWNIVSYACICL